MDGEGVGIKTEPPGMAEMDNDEQEDNVKIENVDEDERQKAELAIEAKKEPADDTEEDWSEFKRWTHEEPDSQLTKVEKDDDDDMENEQESGDYSSGKRHTFFHHSYFTVSNAVSKFVSYSYSWDTMENGFF